MSSPDGANNDVIEARTAPLSHLTTSKGSKTWRLDKRNSILVTSVATVAIVLVAFGVLWQPTATLPNKPQSSDSSADSQSQPQPSPASEQTESTQLAPFAQLNAQRTRELAQRELAQFVEKQILLEETMQVGTWGESALATAKSLAIEGDADFVAERFASSIEKYSTAVAALTQLIENGNALYDSHLQNGLHAIGELDTDSAIEELTRALIIKPSSEAAKAALTRAEQLPQIIGLLRTAKNHELGERYNEAVAVYDSISKLDPRTPDLPELRSKALAGAQGNNLNSFISDGFAALERKEFEVARTAFNKALQLEPGNDIAEGGIQQVQKRNDLTIIAQYRLKAEQAIEEEAWAQALDSYQQILNLDGNIQFALSGKRLAQAHERAEKILTRIKNDPQKLSSEKLYLDAQAIVSEAGDLTQKGPALNALVAEVADLLAIYRDPVDVVLLSDSATNIVVSNVGNLGTFDRKTLSLRPGQYTIRGSRNGCRDIYLSVDVLPGIDPINLSCQDEVGQ